MGDEKGMTLLPSYPEALDYLGQFQNYERTADYPAGTGALGTARMERLLDLLDNPQQNYPVLHISGTKGKGSTAYLTAGALAGLGLRCGLYTSPHITELLERIQIGGRNLNRAIFCKSFAAVRSAAEKMGPDNRPTYFEMLTAICYQSFADQAVDIAVIEVGLGGRLDATNVSGLPVVASAITPVSYDHMKVLGNELTDIALEKAGILRQGTTLVLGRQEASARKVIERKAERLNCRVWEVGRELVVTDYRDLEPAENGGVMQVFSARSAKGEYTDIPLALAGAHQRENALAAIGLVEAFLEASIDNMQLSRAWHTICPPGRFESVHRKPDLVLDGAHNPASAWALAETVNARFPSKLNRVMVFSACADKDVRGVLRILLPLVRSVIFTTNNSPRHMPPAEMARIAMELDPHIRQDVKDNPCAAVTQALKIAGDDGVVLVTGSLYLIGDVRPFCLSLDNK